MPTWAGAHAETWKPSSAVVVRMELLPKGALVLAYQYDNLQGQQIPGEFGYESDPMHTHPWHWDEQEFRAHF